MQRLLYRVDWDVDAARDRLQAFVRETFGDPEGIGVLDETGFLKKGVASVGVQRQRWGTAGKVENCPDRVSLTDATPRGHVFLDRRLYLPEAWCEDPVRRARAKVSEEAGFPTKPELAIAMLGHAWAQGVPMRWGRGDEADGDASRLRETIERHGCGYVLAVLKGFVKERDRRIRGSGQSGGRSRKAGNGRRGRDLHRGARQSPTSSPESRSGRPVPGS